MFIKTDRECAQWLLSLLAQDRQGNYYRRDNGTLKKFCFHDIVNATKQDYKDIDWLNQQILETRGPDFRWNVSRVPKLFPGLDSVRIVDPAEEMDMAA